MQNSLVAGRRAAIRTAITQVVVTLVLALMFWLLGSREAIAAAVGGAAATLGSALMAWRAVGGGVASGGAALMRLLGGMALKWLVVMAALYWALAVARLPPGPLLIGLGAALVVPILNLKKQR
ncbi:MAG: ATP synthase subunit I [Xanthomonadales bacterium]|nr:ATP synthase subunit I [Xanthomonadales bacterium]